MYTVSVWTDQSGRVYSIMYKFLCLVTITSVLALPKPDEGNKVEKVQAIKKDCANGILSSSCLKLGAITLLEKLNNKDEVSLIPGISLVKEGGQSNYDAVASDLARSLSNDPEDKLDKSLLYQVGSFLDSHSVKLRLLDDSAVEEAKTAMEEGRSKKKKSGIGAIIAMAAMMKGT